MCGGVGSAFLGLLLDPDLDRGPCLDPRKAAAFAQLDVVVGGGSWAARRSWAFLDPGGSGPGGSTR